MIDHKAVGILPVSDWLCVPEYLSLDHCADGIRVPVNKGPFKCYVTQ